MPHLLQVGNIVWIERSCLLEQLQRLLNEACVHHGGAMSARGITACINNLVSCCVWATRLVAGCSMAAASTLLYSCHVHTFSLFFLPG